MRYVGYRWAIGSQMSWTKDNPRSLSWFLLRGWFVQNGQNSTENLLNRYARFTDSEGEGGGGSSTITVSGSVKLNSVSLSSAAGVQNTSNNGSHGHSVTVDQTTLTVADMPVHNHQQVVQGLDNNQGRSRGYTVGNPTLGYDGLNDSWNYTKDAGGNVAHSHGVNESQSGEHSHELDLSSIAANFSTVGDGQLDAQTVAVLPLYFACVPIIFKGKNK